MPLTKTIRIWDGATGSKSKDLWCSQSIANINAIINNNLDAEYTITKAVLKVYANFDGAGGLANVYMKYGFGSTSAISKQLSGTEKLTKDDACYPSSGVDITSYFTNKRQPKTITTSHGNYFVANIYTSNIVVGGTGALHLSYVDLYVEYELTHSHIILTVSPAEGGTVTGGGHHERGTTVTLKATPNAGYRFVGWYYTSETLNSLLYPNSTWAYEVSGTIPITAVFKKTINQIQIGKTEPSGIYYNATTKTITFVIADAVSIPSSGADTVDGYHLVISNTAPSGATPIKGVQVGTTYVYTA